MMIGAVLYHFIPSAREAFQNLITNWWLTPALVVITLILFWRHTTLAYGDIKVKEGWRMVSGVLILFTTPFLFGVGTGNKALIELLLVVLMMDRLVSSIAIKHSPFYLFDIGFLIGLLSLLHPAYLILIPYFIYKFYQIENNSIRHVLAQILGTTAVWVLLVLIYADPNIESIREVLSTKLAPLLSTNLGSFEGLSITFATALLLLSTIVIFHTSYRNSISRVRFLSRSHLTFSLLILILHIIYGNQTPSFMMVILFFSSSPAFYFCSKSRTRIETSYLFLMLSISFFVVVILQKGLLTDLFQQIIH